MHSVYPGTYARCGEERGKLKLPAQILLKSGESRFRNGNAVSTAKEGQMAFPVKGLDAGDLRNGNQVGSVNAQKCLGIQAMLHARERGLFKMATS